VETITLEPGAAYGCMAAGLRVSVFVHGLWLRLNAGPCLWRTAPLQCFSISCNAI